jgi:hypothetical protein
MTTTKHDDGGLGRIVVATTNSPLHDRENFNYLPNEVNCHPSRFIETPLANSFLPWNIFVLFEFSSWQIP